jgi:DNA adenine methylase
MLVRPLKWHGGKHYLAKWIISHFPPHLHYVEPYFGGGAVLFARDPTKNWYINEEWKLHNGEIVPARLKGCSEVINDIDKGLTNFWKVLKDETKFDKFVRIVEATPFSKIDWLESIECNSCDPVERATAFFVRYRQSRQGLGRDFATLSRKRTRGGRNEQSNSWLSAIDGLSSIHERLRGVVILCDHAINVIRQQDEDTTLFYLDPTYLHETRTTTKEYGEHEMTPEDHETLLQTLVSLEGKFILSGYHSDMYDDFAADQGWRCEEYEIDNKASGKKKKDKKIECLWMNF